MAFVVDGSEWRFDGWSPDEIISAIEIILERVSVAHERQEIIWIGDDFQTQPVLGELDLWSLFAPGAPLNSSPEVRQELSAWLGRVLRYADEDVWPNGAEETIVQVDIDPAMENADVAWAHHHVRAGRAVACLSFLRSGSRITVSNRGSATVFWVKNERSHRDFWRSAIDTEGNKESTLQRLAPHAFPDLYFYTTAWRGLRGLIGGYVALSSEIRRYLGTLDDHGRWVFTCPPPVLSPDELAIDDNSLPSNQTIEQRFARLRLTIAPENPDVYANKVCREAREIKIKDITLYCEWHGKLEPHQNRLHIHPPVPQSSNKVIIAIFHPHLPLPRDG